jgi:hypothetical protein
VLGHVQPVARVDVQSSNIGGRWAGMAPHLSSRRASKQDTHS